MFLPPLVNFMHRLGTLTIFVLFLGLWVINPDRDTPLIAQPKPAPQFKDAGKAFLKQHCNACHSGDKPKADLKLDVYADDAAILKDRKTWQRVLDVMKAGEMPPESRPQPKAEEREAFTGLIAGIFERHDKTAKPDPGRVTMRRLNRNEYNNTIRDLVGLDNKPAEDFPSDDVGYGFDNIGDVLSLPTVLLERYLASAEAIMDKAILTTVPPIPKRYLAGKYLQPAPQSGPASMARFRHMNPTDANPMVSGPFTAPADYLKFSANDDLILRARLYATTTGKSPVKVALFISGGKVTDTSPDAEVDKLMGAGLKNARPLKILKIYEITARDEKKIQEIEFPINHRGDIQRAGIAVVKPPEGEDPPQLFIENIWSEGPLDTLPPSHRKLLACDPKKPQAEQSREVLTRFATRAYRRPATKDEVDRLLKLADSVIAKGGKWEAGMQFAMTAVLTSPKFLFRVELDDRPDSAESHPIDEYQLASRLSYFLWASMPDEELFELASKKQLTANLDKQVKRMLTDPKAQSLTDNFAMQWLQLQPLRNAQPDPKKFPNFNEGLKAAMFTETRMFLEEIAREDRSVLDILNGQYTYLNAPLAKHYGIADTVGNRLFQDKKSLKPGGKPFKPNEFVRVDLSGSGRGGILTQASVLTVTSNPTRTSPVKRGKWVLEQILGTPPPPPPANVPELEKDGKPVTNGTLKQQMEAHRSNPACANCHAKMDGLGFGLENFDAIGAYRIKDGELAIDSTGELPGNIKFSGPDELKKILMDRKDLFAKCLTEKLLTYALGRGLEYYDRRAVDAIVADAAKQDYKLSAIVTGIVNSDPFRLRRGK